MREDRPAQLLSQLPRGTAARGRQMLVGGGVFAALGLLLSLLSLGVVETTGRKIDPPWIGHVVAVLFLVTGLHLCRFGWLAERHQKRRKRVRKLRRSDPWYADYPWNPEREEDGALEQVVGCAFAIAFVALFLAPFNWLAFGSEHSGPLLIVPVSIVDLALSALVVHRLRRIVQLLRYGRSWVAFSDFPYRLGGELRLRFGMRRDLAMFESMRCTLRFVEERIVTSGTGEHRTRTVEAYELYRDEQVFDQSAHRGRARELELRFELPADEELLTRLAKHPPRYWELHVHGAALGVDFEARFALPVYLVAEEPETAEQPVPTV
jgi:hypothetical protein